MVPVLLLWKYKGASDVSGLEPYSKINNSFWLSVQKEYILSPSVRSCDVLFERREAQIDGHFDYVRLYTSNESSELRPNFHIL
jgi:hypothetical protein